MSDTYIWQNEPIYLGGREVWPREIATYALLEVVERDWDGQWLCFALYFLAGCLFLGGVLSGSLDHKFLIAVVFFAALGAMSAADALSIKQVGVYRIEVVTHQGERIVHAIPTLAEAADLTRYLDALARTR